jgi:hypothetical protein
LHKDKYSDDGRLFAGPIWDFNLGFPNHYNSLRDQTQG